MQRLERRSQSTFALTVPPRKPSRADLVASRSEYRQDCAIVKEHSETASSCSVIGAKEITQGLARLGVQEGEVILVHCSLSSFGYVAGGEQSVLQALRDAVGVFGTIVMPTQSWQLCDPDFLDDSRLSPTDRVALRRSLPPFDEVMTPTRTMGSVAELFRLLPDAHRSPHPHRSFSAAGIDALSIVREHDFADPFGETSPLARLYEQDARVVLLGVGFDSCTSLHLAEGRAASQPRLTVRNGAPVNVGGVRQWVSWDEPVVQDEQFPTVGAAFEAAGGVVRATIGSADCAAMSMRELVDFAATELNRFAR